MQKIGVLIIALSIIGCVSADAQCDALANLGNLDTCCYQRGSCTFNEVYEKYYEQARTDGDENPEICASQNAFIETKLLNLEKGAVDYEVLLQMLKDNGLDGVLVNHMMLTVKVCDGLVAEQLRNAPALNEKCSQGPNLIRQCAAINGMRNCPVSKFWVDNRDCMGILNNMKNCPFQI